jgi:hypothetical protein
MIVGYKLLDSEGAVFKSWGGVWGRVPGMPDAVDLPNGDRVHCPELNVSYGGCMLIAWEMDPPPLTTDDVNVERDRRIFPGPITVTSTALAQPIPVDMRNPTDRENLANLMQGAIVAKGQGITDPIVNFGDADNNVTPLTADQVIVLGMAGLAYGSAVWEAARALKAMNPIPADYADDNHWPAPVITYPPA